MYRTKRETHIRWQMTRIGLSASVISSMGTTRRWTWCVTVGTHQTVNSDWAFESNGMHFQTTARLLCACVRAHGFIWQWCCSLFTVALWSLGKYNHCLFWKSYETYKYQWAKCRFLMLKHVVCVVSTVLESVRIHIWKVEVSGCTEILGAHPLADIVFHNSDLSVCEWFSTRVLSARRWCNMSHCGWLCWCHSMMCSVISGRQLREAQTVCCK